MTPDEVTLADWRTWQGGEDGRWYGQRCVPGAALSAESETEQGLVMEIERAKDRLWGIRAVAGQLAAATGTKRQKPRASL